MPNRVRKSSFKQLNFEDDDDTEHSTNSNETKIVQFSTIEIRDYSLCLGDHPDVNRGAPVSLDWEYQSEQSFGIVEYERRSFPKKSHNEMIRLAFEREYTLRKLGYSEEEIKTRSISVKKDQKNRSQTRRTMIFEPFMIISEKTRRWIAKRKCLRNTIDNESNNESMISSCRDSTITSSTALEMSSSYAPSHNFMTENIMVCNQ
jgi:hypothetical protein